MSACPLLTKGALMGIANIAPIACPAPKQTVHELELCIQLSELHLVSDIKGLKLAALLKRTVSSYQCQILGKRQVSSLGQQGLDVSWCYKSTAMMH